MSRSPGRQRRARTRSSRLFATSPSCAANLQYMRRANSPTTAKQSTIPASTPESHRAHATIAAMHPDPSMPKTEISSGEFMSPLSEQTLKAVAADGVVRTFPKGAILINEGDTSESLFILLSGRVKVYASNASGREIVLSFFGPGEYVGEMSLDGRRSSTRFRGPRHCWHRPSP